MKIIIFLQVLWIFYLLLRILLLKQRLNLESSKCSSLETSLKLAWEENRKNNPFRNSNHGKHEFGHDYD